MSTTMHQYVKNALAGNSGMHDSWSLFFDKFSGYDRKNKSILENVVKYYDGLASRENLEKMLVQKYQFFSELTKRGNIKLLFFENTSRLLVNMGHSQVLENVGFAFERISGLPCVPGSALKGVVANWALWDANGDAAFTENLQGFSTNRAELNQQLVDVFGANEGEAEQGKINFHGIFPMTLPKLEIDIITPHPHNKPINPIHFLTVAAGTLWYVPVAYNRSGDGSGLLDTTELLIEKCLTHYGVGAKTASGYGKFDVADCNQLETAKKFIQTVIDKEKIEQEKLAAERLESERKIAEREAAELARIEAARQAEADRIARQEQLKAQCEEDRKRLELEAETKKQEKLATGLSHLESITDVGRILADVNNYLKAKNAGLDDTEKQQLIEMLKNSFNVTGKKDNKWAKPSKSKDTWNKINQFFGAKLAAELRRELV